MRQWRLQRVISLVSSTLIWPFDSGNYACLLCNTLSSATTYEHLTLVTCLSTEEPSSITRTSSFQVEGTDVGQVQISS